MRVVLKLIAVALLILVVAACSNDSSNESADESTELAGPALVMFYTDN